MEVNHPNNPEKSTFSHHFQQPGSAVVVVSNSRFVYESLKNNIINQQALSMGCGPAPKKAEMEKKDTPVGALKVTILGAEIYSDEKFESPSIKVRVSNQSFQTQMIAPPSPQQKVRQTFVYCINSFYKPHGRIIEVGFFDKDHLISFGSIDANPSIQQGIVTQSRCILNRKGQAQQQHGYVHLRATFQNLPYWDLTFRFQEATIRRKTGCWEDNVASRLTIGEECLETEHLPDSLKRPPAWADHKYNFKVPEGLKKGFLDLVDDKNNKIGSTELNLEDYVRVKEGDEVIETQTLFHKEGNDLIKAGQVKYSFIAGKYAEFKPRSEMLLSVVRAIRPQSQFSQTSMVKEYEIDKV